MGGPRITEQQIARVRELYATGMSLSKISKEVGISTTSVSKYASDVEVSSPLLDGEVVADIEGYGGRYKVSNLGRVFSTAVADAMREVKIRSGKRGICRVSLTSNGSVDWVRVDWLVGTHFCDKPDDSANLVHVDGDTSNNEASNLRWVKAESKLPHVSRRALNDADAEAVREKWLAGRSLKSIAAEFGVSVYTVFKQTVGLRRDVPEPDCEDGEEWAPIVGYEGRYLISSHGRVYSTGCGRWNPRIMAVAIRDGYMQVSLASGGDNKTYQVHRLVAMAFCDGHDEEHNTVNHIDGNTLNNHADNLEWCTVRYNTEHARDVLGVEMGGSGPFENRTERKYPRRESRPSPFRRFTADEVAMIRNDPRSARQLAKQFGVNKCTIQNIRLGKTYSDLP